VTPVGVSVEWEPHVPKHLSPEAEVMATACRSLLRYGLRQTVASQGCLSRGRPGGR
jgi:hypothetical protein